MRLGEELVMRVIEIGKHGIGWEIRSKQQTKVYVVVFVPADASRAEALARFGHGIADAIDQAGRGENQ